MFSLIEYSGLTLTLITIFGSLIAFFAATVGLVQNDIKKLLLILHVHN